MIANPIEFDNLIPKKFKNMIKFKSMGSFKNWSRKYSKKFVCFLNSSLSQKIFVKHSMEDKNKFQLDLFSDAIINDPTK